MQVKRNLGRVERVREEPSPSSNRTCGFPAYGFRVSLLYEAFTSRSVQAFGSAGRQRPQRVLSKVADCAGADGAAVHSRLFAVA